ncbi:MAG: oligosaccharide flippase family protein [Candidatus Eisenbacteria bacterium]|nr:oligosaccharide flippase family protein [Candidatus Eisenbacteria bacterium]
MSLLEEPRERIADLIRQSAVYGVGALATQLAGVFLLPILARVLTPAEYGIVFLAEMLGLLMFAVIELGLTSAFFRFYGEEREEAARRSLIYSIFNFLLLECLAVTLVCVLFSGRLSSIVFGTSAWRSAFLIVCVTNLLTILSRMPLDLLRMNRRAALFVFISCCRLAATFLTSLYLVVYARRGVMGVLEGTLVGTAVGFVMLAPVILRRWKPTMELPILKKALRFGAFLVPGGLALWALNQSDRYLLRQFGDLTMVAVYGVGFKFASAVNLFLVTPFLTAWSPFMFRVSTQENAKQLYSRTLTYFALLSVGILVLLSATIGDIIRFVAGASYADAAPVVPFVAMGFVLYGVASVVVVGIYLRERTYHVSLAMICGAIVKITLSVLVIPYMGVLGVALATVAAFGVVVTYFLLVLRRLFPVAYELIRILKIVLAGLVSYLCLAIIPLTGLGAVGVKTAGSLVFLLLLWLLRFPSQDEKQKIRVALGRIVRFP